MSDSKTERAWLTGHNQAHRVVMMSSASALGYDLEECKKAALVAQIDDAHRALAEMAREMGIDDDWSRKLNLSDVILKRILRPYLRGETE